MSKRGLRNRNAVGKSAKMFRKFLRKPTYTTGKLEMLKKVAVGDVKSAVLVVMRIMTRVHYTENT